MPDLTDDQIARLREIASKDVWHPVDAMEVKQTLPALLDENDMLSLSAEESAEVTGELRAENTALGVRYQEQYDRAEAALDHCGQTASELDRANQDAASWRNTAERTADRLYHLIETVRDVADDIATRRGEDALEVAPLRAACTKAQEATDGE